ncbi:MAG: TM2 domain-containing protein [Pleurocapsa sp. MO_226.B13]|nr:TM2 domain-containing protein [Pleurocapsa sp. MO_226.B13]
MRNTGIAYLLWSLWFFGFAGIHRFYLGKPISGLIWFLTWGLFGMGQIVDFFLIPDMVERKNFKYRARLREARYEQLPAAVSTTPPPSDTQLILKLLSEQPEATLADCVLATGKDTSKVKALLEQMQRDELIEVGNRERDGAIVYRMI